MADRARKQPFYLVLALLGALALGANGAFAGWATILLYREPIDATVVGLGIGDEADRTAVVARFEAYLHALDLAQPRAWPLAVATLLLGTAVLLFATRALGGSRGARAVLVQLVVAQAGVHALGFWLVPDVLDAELHVHEAKQAAEAHEQFVDRVRADDVTRTTARLVRVMAPLTLVLRTLGSAAVVLALTTRRTRDFFEKGTQAVER